jgi:hydrogenase maturation protein HypF
LRQRDGGAGSDLQRQLMVILINLEGGESMASHGAVGSFQVEHRFASFLRERHQAAIVFQQSEAMRAARLMAPKLGPTSTKISSASTLVAAICVTRQNALVTRKARISPFEHFGQVSESWSSKVEARRFHTPSGHFKLAGLQKRFTNGQSTDSQGNAVGRMYESTLLKRSAVFNYSVMVSTANGEVTPTGVSEVRRLRVALQGAVQGVGFRPFVFRLANELKLAGWVENNAHGVCLEVEGLPASLTGFLVRLERDKPPQAFFQSLEPSWLDPAGYTDFKIRASSGGPKTALVLPDIATCPECRQEIFDPNNRRYLYPFTNCTHCGPRFSIIEALPYDRVNTSMREFTLCPECKAEYENPLDRRFHAQPNACPQCGPRLDLWDEGGQVRVSQHAALLAAAAALREGKVLALKGLGGFQLLVDARQSEAVQRLRQRKHREEKPFAVMFPSLVSVREHCEVADLEERLLGSAESPIVLLRTLARPHLAALGSTVEAAGRSADDSSEGYVSGSGSGSPRPASPIRIAREVAPGNPCLGAMLPYTPLHHLLMAELGFPVVATSGNLSDEPICLDEREALRRLHGIADLWLVHNRRIVRQVDDSVARVMLGRELVLRRARGYAPLPVHLKAPVASMLAVGAHLKNTVAMSVGLDIFVSQHIGDLETPEAFAAFKQVITNFTQLYDLHPTAVACDAHPDYRSTQFARQSNLPVIPIQHHHAHVRACMADNELEPPVLGISWDGTGYGLDGSVWGGEFLHVEADAFQRLGSFRPFRLPGGEAAVQEPRRVALGLLYEVFGPSVFAMRELEPVRSFEPRQLELLRVALQNRLNTPWTTSAGRLFDAVASLVGLRQISRFEGQAAMELEFALSEVRTEQAYPLRLLPGKTGFTASEQADPKPANGRPRGPNDPGQSVMIMVDWEPMIWGLLEDVRCRVPAGVMAAKFHHTLAEAVVGVARLAGVEQVALTGGCFQNRYLTERVVQRLAAEGFRPYWHQRIPPNDGGIALGQIMAAANRPRPLL